MSKGISTTHDTATKTNPSTVVEVDLEPGKGTIVNLLVEDVEERHTPSNEDHDGIDKEVSMSWTGINVLGSKGTYSLVAINGLVDGTEEL